MPVLDKAFFDGPDFSGKVHEYTVKEGTLGVRVEVVTLDGDRLDTLELETTESEARLITRDDRLVFLPYAQIAHVDVSPLRDHRTTSFRFPANAT